MSQKSSSPSTGQLYETLLRQVSAVFCPDSQGAQDSGSASPILSSSDIIRIFKVASELPYSADVESLKGWCFEKVQKHELAIYVYDEVLNKCPLHGPTLRRRGQLLKKLARLEESEEMFELATLVEPDNLHLEILQEKTQSCSSEANNQESKVALDCDQESQNIQDKSAWVIKIKSIDRALPREQSLKNVIFKSELLEQIPQASTLQVTNSLAPLRKRKSILKTCSQEQFLHPEGQQGWGEVKSEFDVNKLKSIDGKYSTASAKPSKEIVFTRSTAESNLHSPTRLVKRKSSIVTSKFSSERHASSSELK